MPEPRRSINTVGRQGTPFAPQRRMNSIIYIVGLVVIVIAVLSFVA